MNKSSKCKNCQWYGKPYWSIINPCDNCPNENINVEIFTRWQDPTINDLQQQLDKYKNVIDKINKLINTDYGGVSYYYKYNNKYLKSEIKEDINKLLEEVE